MARLRGRTKTARVTVNLDDPAYAVLLAIAGREDIPVGQVARRTVMDYLARDQPSLGQTMLPLIRSLAGQAKGQGQ